MKNLKRIITTLLGLTAVMALPSYANAATEPIRPDSGIVPPTSPELHRAPAAEISSSGWGTALVVGAVVVVLLAGLLVVVGQRVARQRRRAASPALGV